MTKLSGWVGAGVLTAGVSAAMLIGAGAANADTDADSDHGPARTSSPTSEQPAGTPHLKGAAHSARAGTPGNHRTVETGPDVRPQIDTSSQASKAVSSTARSASAGRTVEFPAALALPRPDLAPLVNALTPLVNAVLSPVLGAIGAVARIVDGPPIVPPALRDSIVVSSATLVVAPGTEVPADWYFPTQGEPQRLIYLQHGFGATGPMYSSTASYLAERTNSVVVVTTLSPNWLKADGMSLNGDNMHKAIAQLLLDPDRDALNASLTTATLKAGRDSFAVPQQFVLVGHSAGGGFAVPVAGYYAEGLVARRADGQDDPNDLAGVVLLDGVTTLGIMPSALDRLKQLELSNGNDPADYVPVYQLGAPPNMFNSVSRAIQDLSAARPGQFIGVVVNGGVHMDSMLGGNPLVQGVAYLFAGIPQPQNPPGVQWLIAGWIHDMFESTIDPVTGRCLTDCDGAYGTGGETIDVDGDHGDATAVVIDSGSLPDESAWNIAGFTPIAASFIPASVLSRWA